MEFDLRHREIAAILVLVLLATLTDPRARAPSSRPFLPPPPAGAPLAVKNVIAGWPPVPRALAAICLKRFGRPDLAAPSRLSWSARPPWSRVVVFRDAPSGSRPAHLLEAVAYGPVSPARLGELAALGFGAVYDPATGELSARTDGEATNFLALNLADDVLQGRRDAADARAFYAATLDLALSGKTSPYMTGLRFQPRGR
ncbi:MAG TPA: hypothetical protein VH309_08315 [Elusimicrobiota bacterium]|jgi:hypothetical protein|nr:hypothetical protein [Elusimicrobiota bacterium]